MVRTQGSQSLALGLTLIAAAQLGESSRYTLFDPDNLFDNPLASLRI